MTEDTRFYLAQTLEERQSALRNSNSCGTDEDLATKRLERWKSSSVFLGNELFAEFLSGLNLNESQFRNLLGQDAAQIEQLYENMPQPEWIKDLHSALDTATELYPRSQKKRSEKVESTDEFLILLSPLISCFKTKLKEAIPEQRLFDPALITDELLASLLLRLRRLIQKTLILETNIARLQNRLSGTSPEERYSSYIQLLQNREERLSILLEYPVLARKCLLHFNQWYEASKEFLLRLLEDHHKLKEHFSLDLNKLVSVRGSAGDAHKQGRSVHILEFANEEKLIYKPRSLAADQKFQDLLSYLNDNGLDPPLRTMGILDCGEYGWTEFIHKEGCKQKEELKRFYTRQGALLAILYLSSSTDVHLENLIAAGEDPVVVDLEAIFHPDFSQREDLDRVDKIAINKYVDSVMSVGLLPTPQHAAGRSMDKSALGAVSNQTLPFDVDGIEKFGTDEIRVAKVPGRIGEIHSRPDLNGIPANVCEYRDEIADGFSKAYKLILELRDSLVSADGRISQFSCVSTRAVIRPSGFYADLLNEAQHPTFMRNAIDQDLIFKELYRSALQNSAYLRTIPSERKQLLQGDIPYFICKANSKDLETAGGTTIPNALQRSGMDICIQRLRRMCDEDLCWQLWLIDASLSTLSIRHSRLLSRKGFPDALESSKSDPLLSAAVACADRLLETAIRHNGECTWVSLNYAGGSSLGSEEHNYHLGTCKYDLYRGTAGIAFFLAYLYKLSSDIKYKTLAEESIAFATNRLSELKASRSPGAFIGLGSYIYAQTHLACVLDQEDRIQLALDELKDLETFIEADMRLDLMAGTAGCIPVLLSLAALRPNSSALELARKCADKLIQLGSKSLIRTLSWKELPMPRGFSHGHAGIACCLAELAAVTQEKKYSDAARATHSFELHLFKDGWTDISESRDSAAWCHGSPGIALSRMRMFQLLGDEEGIGDYALLALDALISAPAREDHILCHGSLGNLEPFLMAKKIFPFSKDWRKLITENTKRIISEIETDGWRSNLPPQVMEPGLMIGLAGIGYGFLRLHDPDRIPSVLLLDPPTGS